MKIKSSLFSLMLFTQVLLSGIMTSHAQNFVQPILPTGEVSDFSPAFHALKEERFRAELFSQQQYLAIARHPASYRLSVSGTPKSLHLLRTKLTFHGDLYSQQHGFQYNFHGAFGTTATVEVHPQWSLIADLHYDFGYKYYRFEEVITEHPDYGNVPYNTFFHTPTASLGLVYDFRSRPHRIGFIVNGSTMLPDRDYVIGGTMYADLLLRQNQKQGCVSPFLNYTYYTYNQTGHTVSVGCNGQYRMVHAKIVYRASADIQVAGIGIGLDLGKYCYLGYTFIAPFRYSGVMAGVAAHNVSFRATIRHKKIIYKF